MKKILFNIVAVIIAIIGLSSSQYSFKPACPSGTAIFVLKSTINTSTLSGSTLRAALTNTSNWIRIDDNIAGNGSNRACAICAIISNPNQPIKLQIPSFSDSSKHTKELMEKFEDYALGGRTSDDDSIAGLFFEMN